MSLENNKTMCYAPFFNAVIGVGGRVRPCCRIQLKYSKDISIHHNDLTSIFNSNTFNQLRSDFKNGIYRPECQKCYDEELAGNKSMRQGIMLDNPHIDIEKPKITSFEISPSNKCNLKCRICNGELSTAWKSDEHKLHKYENIFKREVNKPKDPYSINLNHLNDLTEVRILGGEPFIMKETLEILKSIENKENISISVNTNCTVFPEYIELLKKFKFVEVFLSIDAFGERNEYIRRNSKWEETVSVIDKWSELNKLSMFKIILFTTVSIYNIEHLSELHEWNELTHNLEHKFIILKDPSYLSCLLLSDEKIDEVLKELERNQLNHVARYLKKLKHKNKTEEIEKFNLFENILNDSNCSNE